MVLLFPDMRSPPVYYVQAPTPESLAGVVPYVAAPPGMFISAPDPVRAMLVKQIDYYFRYLDMPFLILIVSF